MKFNLLICAFFFSSFFASGASAAEPVPQPELVAYTYDSFVARGGLGPEITAAFEAQCGCKLKLVGSGDGAQILTRLELDAKRGVEKADLVVGIDQQLWTRAKPFALGWGQWRPKGFSDLVGDVREPDARDGFLPYDYGYFSLIEDHQTMKELGIEAPKSLKDLNLKAFRRALILEDPRTSTPGLALVLFSNQVLGAGAFKSFWHAMRTQWLTLAPGWDGAYGIFMKKEAPLVWSYISSQAYHEEHGDRARRYEAVLFEEGQPVQIEGAAILKGTAHAELAREFLDFLISADVQKKIPTRNWMMPVLKGVELPESFKHLPRPKKGVPTAVSADAVRDALARWNQAVTEP